MAWPIRKRLFVIQQIFFVLLLVFAGYAIFVREENPPAERSFDANPVDAFALQKQNLTEAELKQVQRYLCPAGMVAIPGGEVPRAWIEGKPEASDEIGERTRVPPFCMDIYEYPNERHVRPRVRVSYNEAKTLCRNVQKRLCREEEWLLACAGTEGRLYVYGAERQAWRCNTDGVSVGSCGGIAPAGSHAGCYDKYGVFDLNGNVSEWVEQECDGCGVVRGDTAWEAEYGQSCFSRHVHPAGDNQYCDDGLRCCDDAERLDVD